MWHHGDVVLRTCPVRELTPEADAVIALFDACYAPIATGLAVQWQRIALPRQGAVCDQPAWLLAAFDVIANVRNALLREHRPKKSSASDAPGARKARRRV